MVTHESTQRELSNEYQHGSVLVHWTKVASALEVNMYVPAENLRCLFLLVELFYDEEIVNGFG